jgi:undecaprenyl-diphosphatase
MTFFDALILGIVEGFTEFLPISSTAHLVLTAELLRIPESAFLSSFIIAIQLGAIASVMLIYWRTILWDFEIMKRVAVAFVPTAIAGFALYSLLKSYLIENLIVIASALLIGGVILVIFEYFHKRETATVIVDGPVSYSTAFWVGCVQALAIVPGVSRAGATVIAGLMLGLRRTQIVEFSFLLAIPTMLAATGYDILKTGSTFTAGDWELLVVGFVMSFIAAYVSVRWLLRYIQTHTFTGFGWYRIVLGGGLLIWLVL